MISDTYNISEFLDKAKNCSYRRVLVMADQEATEVERCLYKKNSAGSGAIQLHDYVDTLKDFIAFLRYGIKSKSVRNLDLDYFCFLRESS
jgi:hypothetical protein